MIGYLRGTLHEVKTDGVILDVQGVGYDVTLSQRTLAELPPVGEEVAVTIATIVREESLTLYGFTDALDKRLFNLLLSVSGIGPRQAIHLLSNCSADDLVAAITGMDVGFLESMRGIGRKTAEKIVIELKDRLVKMLKEKPYATSKAGAPHKTALRQDLIAALTQLGYRRPQINDLLARLPLDEITDVEQAVRKSLQLLYKSGATGNSEDETTSGSPT